MPNLDLEKQYRDPLRESFIAGVDEAGRGPLAGPVSVSAVILPHHFKHSFLDDSKKLSEKKREVLYEELTQNSEIKWVSRHLDASVVDEINILQATYRGMRECVLALIPQPHFVLIDGRDVPDFPLPSQGIIKGDQKSLSIAAASIIAKVERDRMMVQYAEEYPEYGFEKHKGYGTKAHLAALEKHGPCPIHRCSFQPVAQCSLPFAKT